MNLLGILTTVILVAIFIFIITRKRIRNYIRTDWPVTWPAIGLGILLLLIYIWVKITNKEAQ